MGQPALAVGKGGGAGLEQGADPIAGQQGIEHGGVTAVSKSHPDAAGGGDAGCSEFGGHAASAPLTSAGGHRLQAVELGQAGHLLDRPGLGIAAGVA